MGSMCSVLTLAPQVAMHSCEGQEAHTLLERLFSANN